MSANKDSIQRTLLVTVLLCLVCSVIVAGSAVSLRDLQNENKANNMRIAVLQAAGLYDANKTVEEQFANIQTRIVNIKEGRFASTEELAGLKAAGFSLENFDQRKASKKADFSRVLKGSEDIASIKRVTEFANAYVIEKDNQIDNIVLPIHGYGLWSTLYGFIALESDLNTVAGLGFYEHAETPGLGGEVDNSAWKAKWQEKHVYNDQGEVAISVIKGHAEKDSLYQIDGLSGATLTSRGVTNLVHFWMGENGFGKFLANLKQGGI